MAGLKQAPYNKRNDLVEDSWYLKSANATDIIWEPNIPFKASLELVHVNRSGHTTKFGFVDKQTNRAYWMFFSEWNDNRIENLELWSSSQPSGQRVADKIAWALEILERYGQDPSGFQ